MLLRKVLLCMSLALATTAPLAVRASDHDDGEADLKGRALNLTDVYAFREDKEVVGGSAAHLVFIINTNPRSLPRQQYYFSTTAHYDFHIARVGTSKNVAAKTTEDIILRVMFGAPDTSGKQAITFTTIVDGTETSKTTDDSSAAMTTTPIGTSPLVSTVTINGQAIQVFAGLRRDPFFFDVTSFFRFRIAAAGTNGSLPVPGFANFPAITPSAAGESASDFTANYNVNSMAFRVPIAFLQKSGETVFDSWATISVPQ